MIEQSDEYLMLANRQTRRVGILSVVVFIAASFSAASFSAAGSIAVAQDWPPHIDGESFVYKTTPQAELKLWVFRPAAETAAPQSGFPAIVFYFGGGWRSGTPTQFVPQAEYLASRGVVAVVADYRVASRHKTLAIDCVEDACSAIRWLRSNSEMLRIDPDRICAGGGSAGGHLACATAVMKLAAASGEDAAVSAEPNALALFNPALVLAPLDGEELDAAALERFAALESRLGTKPTAISPIHNLRAGLPPTIIFHGEQDPTVSIAGIREFTKRSEALGNRCELYAFAGARHGFFNLRPTGRNSDQQRQWHLRCTLQLDRFLTSLNWLQGDATVPVVDNDAVRVRGRLGKALAGLRHKQSARVAFLGGSITEMEGYRPHVEQWLTEEFPNTQFEFVRAGIASTCSNTGAFRMQRDVLSGGPVDLLFVEFAVNDDQDAAHDADGCVRGMEGVLRQYLTANPESGAVMIHFVNPPMLETAQGGGTQLSALQHERVAVHYNVSSIDLPQELANRIADGSMTWKQWGGTHPGPAGNLHAAQMVQQVLQAVLSSPVDGNEDPELPAPLLGSSFFGGEFLAADQVQRRDGWQLSIPDWKSLPGSSRARFTGETMLHSEQSGSSLAFSFTGRAVGAFVLAGPDAGQLEYRIDDGEWKSVELYHRFSRGLHYPRTVMFESELAAKEHQVEVRVSAAHHADSKGTAARVLSFVVNR